VLHRLADPSWQPSSEKAEVVDFAKGQQLLSAHTETLFGPAPKGRGVRIMVTMPSEAAENYLLVQTLLLNVPYRRAIQGVIPGIRSRT
jgi:pyruvate kinase